MILRLVASLGHDLKFVCMQISIFLSSIYKLKSCVSFLQKLIYHARLFQNSSNVFDFVFGFKFNAFAFNLQFDLELSLG